MAVRRVKFTLLEFSRNLADRNNPYVSINRMPFSFTGDLIRLSIKLSGRAFGKNARLLRTLFLEYRSLKVHDDSGGFTWSCRPYIAYFVTRRSLSPPARPLIYRRNEASILTACGFC
jgi:hypothetical protein